jgi:hypothetical protein
MIILATKAADCGISSQMCEQSYWNRIAPSMYSLVQEMEHVDRNSLMGTGGNGNNQYDVHMLFPCLVKLYVKIMQHPDPAECAIRLASMKEVLVLLVTPNKCQHNMMEKYFKNPAYMQIYKPCRDKFTQCTAPLSLAKAALDCCCNRSC